MSNFANCPVCSHGVYTDPSAPMAKAGSVNPANHSCVKTGTWKDKLRFGGSVSRLKQRLLDTSDEMLAAWPKVLELKRRAEAGEPLE